ncbi:4Fe-4S binding protein [Sulfurovum sp. zt1-1]|uniref:4Fe-4S binding protein n=1 Tax=Sulfurovum zhangzhouensis TaxID=3019067 RepID=A0ABT7R0X6_9BACT|nr:4Fe-4S binding protein [Sulfurovum zhangzhouensis]MDM5272677.1 4Fe-4S binding protein [Sulfurovum zhangzhouensis]
MTTFKKRDKNDIYGMPIVGFFFKNPLFLNGLRVTVLLLFAYGVYMGFVDQTPENTFTRYLFWGLFWSLFIIVSLSSFGRIFCGICPHGFVGKYLTKWGMNREFPKFLKNRYIGISLIVIGWWGVYYAYPSFFKSPLATAMLFFVLTVIAVVFFFVYKEMSYCKYICPIGSLTRAYHRIAPTWLGTYKEDCSQCKTFDCATACSANLKPFTFDKRNSMTDCTLCMDCSTACESVSFKINKPSFSLFDTFKIEKFEVWVFILITAAISITMSFHHALGRTAIADEFIWSKTANFVQQYIDLGSMDVVGLFAFIYAMVLSIGITYIGMFLASKLLNATFEKTFYTLGYAFIPLFIIGGLSHLLQSFFTHTYADIANGFIYGFGLDTAPVHNLAARKETWLNIFNYFPYIAVIWAYVILGKRIGFFNASKVKKTVAFIFASSLITFFLSLNIYKIYVYKTYGFANTGHHHSTAKKDQHHAGIEKKGIDKTVSKKDM